MIKTRRKKTKLTAYRDYSSVMLAIPTRNVNIGINARARARSWFANINFITLVVHNALLIPEWTCLSLPPLSARFASASLSPLPPPLPSSLSFYPRDGGFTRYRLALPEMKTSFQFHTSQFALFLAEYYTVYFRALRVRARPCTSRRLKYRLMYSRGKD